MDKQKQIEEKTKSIAEMAKAIEETMEKAKGTLGGHNNIAVFYAMTLVNAGYRKIPENAVVLTREEHQKYLAFKIIEPQVRGCLDRERELQSKWTS